MIPRLFLFDLDGTLVDSAPDLAAAVNKVRTLNHFEPLDPKSLEPFASQGAPGLIGKAFGISTEDPNYPQLKKQFLDFYAINTAKLTTVYPGMPEVLDGLKARGFKLGVMTNKYERLAKDVLTKLGVIDLFDVVIGSDSEGSAMKPDPDGLLTAAKKLDFKPEETLYAGDDQRDVQAAKAAGMRSAIVGWGYSKQSISAAQADFDAHKPAQLLEWVDGLLDESAAQ